MQAYVQWHQGILNNPKEGMIQLASSLGFDLVKLMGGAQSNANNADNGNESGENWQDPVEARISDFEKRLDALGENERKQVYSQAENLITTFATAKDDKETW